MPNKIRFDFVMRVFLLCSLSNPRQKRNVTPSYDLLQGIVRSIDNETEHCTET